jgi:hypothetical protein
VDERLKRYEALLREKGIDLDQGPGTLDGEHTSSRAEDPDRAWKLPIQSTVFKPQLIQGQGSTGFVDK